MEVNLEGFDLVVVMSMKNRELLILVGMQGSGKTYYCEHFLSDYGHISQDEGPRSYEGIVKKLHGMLIEGMPRIVIDRTNPMREQRKKFAEMGRSAGYFVRIVYFDIPEEICRERIRCREGHPTLSSDKMGEAIAAYKYRLDVPTADECDELAVQNTDSEKGTW
jgi:predicted kinase